MNLLQTRTIKRIPNFAQEFKDSVRLFSTNVQVDNKNARRLLELKTPSTLLTATNLPASGKSKSSDHFRGLENVLHLAVGAKVMLTTNIQPANGLANTVQGTVVDIVYLEGMRPP